MVGSGVGSRWRTCATTRASVLRTSASVSAKQAVAPVGAHVASDSRDRSRSLAPISTTTRSAPRATSSCERPCVRSSSTSWDVSPLTASFARLAARPVVRRSEVASCSRSPAQPQASADGTESPTPTTRRGGPVGRLDGVGGLGRAEGVGAAVTGAAAEDVGAADPARAADAGGTGPTTTRPRQQATATARRRDDPAPQPRDTGPRGVSHGTPAWSPRASGARPGRTASRGCPGALRG